LRSLRDKTIEKSFLKNQILELQNPRILKK
jgi:hypothetical protein